LPSPGRRQTARLPYIQAFSRLPDDPVNGCGGLIPQSDAARDVPTQSECPPEDRFITTRTFADHDYARHVLSRYAVPRIGCICDGSAGLGVQVMALDVPDQSTEGLSCRARHWASITAAAWRLDSRICLGLSPSVNVPLHAGQ